jgi:RNA polymerase sigma-70 factor, ECF subfamily
MDERVQAIWRVGSARCSSFAVASDVFAGYAREVDLADAALEHAGDLLLACACLRNDPRAILELERMLQTSVAGFVARIDTGTRFVDEVRQRLRERLLHGEPPRLLRYSGAGPLESWLRVVAVRLALDLKREAEVAHEPLQAELSHEIVDGLSDPENELLKARYQGVFESAVAAGIQRLTSRQRAVLRLYLLSHLNIEEIGRIYSVNRSSVARWIAAAQKAISSEVVRQLKERQGLSPSEVTSLARVIQSQIQISLARALKTVS